MPSRKRARAEVAAPEEPTSLLSSAAVSVQICKGLAGLWKAKELCDITVVCGGQEFAAHKVVLAAGSAYLRAQFSSTMRDGGASVSRISIEDVSAAAFQAVCEFLYKGETPIAPSSLGAILLAGSRLEVASLLGAGAEWLMAQTAADNAISTWLLADGLGRPVEFAALVGRCQAVTMANFKAAAASDDFTRLRAEHLTLLLAADHPTDADEIDIFRAVVRWAKKQNPQVEHDALGPLFKLVRLTLISADDLSDVVEPEAVFASHPESTRLLCGVFKYHALPPSRRAPAPERPNVDHTIRWNPDDKHEWVRLSEDRLEVCYNGDGNGDDHQAGKKSECSGGASCCCAGLHNLVSRWLT